MTSPAHTRGDSHQEGDIMEIWGRGGENADQNMGYKIVGNTLDDDAGIVVNQATDIPKYSKFSDFITKEATWTATHFFSKDTIYTKPKPSISDTYESFVSSSNEIDKYYIRSYGNGTSSCRNGCVPGGTKLGIKIKSYIIRGLKRYYTGSSRNVLLDKSTTFKGDYSVLKDDAKILIPRAIANARNFLDYFFRGQISAEITDTEIIVTNNSLSSLVTDEYTATLGVNGNYKIMYEDADGTRHPFIFKLDLPRLNGSIACICDSNSLFTGFTAKISVAPGHSVTAPIVLNRDDRVLIRNKKIIVVYDGKIGDERAISVCSAKSPDGIIATSP